MKTIFIHPRISLLVFLCLPCFTLHTRADREILPYSTPKEKAAWQNRTRQFARLWLSRRRRRVTPQLLQMLHAESSPRLRERIVVALGRIEDPVAIKPLQALLVKAQAQQPSRIRGRQDMVRRDSIPPFHIRLAIGRIQARNFKGLTKLNVIARSVGTDWKGIQSQAIELKQQLHDRSKRRQAHESNRYGAVEEFYDVLYRMGKRGENIRSLGAFNLVVWVNETSDVADGLRAQEQAKLFAASLSNRAEISFWLRRSLPPGTAKLSPAHLLDLGPEMPALLKEYLQKCLAEAKSNPRSVAGTNAYISLFEAAVATDNKSFIPLLREFQKVGDRWMRNDAGEAVKQLQSGIGLASVRFPS